MYHLAEQGVIDTQPNAAFRKENAKIIQKSTVIKCSDVASQKRVPGVFEVFVYARSMFVSRAAISKFRHVLQFHLLSSPALTLFPQIFQWEMDLLLRTS